MAKEVKKGFLPGTFLTLKLVVLYGKLVVKEIHFICAITMQSAT